MKIAHGRTRSAMALVASATLALFTAAAFGKDVKVTLTGAEETPPVTTAATGVGTISIAKDHTVKGSVVGVAGGTA